MKKMSIPFFPLAVAFCILCNPKAVFANSIDLNTFTPYPAGDVSISLDGMTATLTENVTIAPVRLHDPLFFVPTDALSLSFEYELVVGEGNEDYFDFYINDVIGSTPPWWMPGDSLPTFWDGGPKGVYTGSISHDLRALQGMQVPVSFDLMFGFGDGIWVGNTFEYRYDSILTISNLQVNTQTPIPEPGTILLMSTGLAGLLRFRRKMKFLA